MTKDVDMMRDTGGTYKHKDLQKPSRSDRKNHGLSEKDPDSKDTRRDPDMKLSRIALKLAKQFLAYKRNKEIIFTGFKENKYNFQKSLIYDVYKDGFVEANSIDGTIHRNLGAHNKIIKDVFDLPMLQGWDEDKEDTPILKKNHKLNPHDFFDNTKDKITRIYHDEDIINRTTHDEYERMDRNNFIDSVVNKNNVIFVGYDQKKRTYQVVYDTGIIEIYGHDNRKITSLIAAPNQIESCYKLPKYIGWDREKSQPILEENHHEKPSKKLLEQCEYYEKNRWNWNELPENKIERDYHKDELIRIRNSKIAKELIKLAKSLIS